MLEKVVTGTRVRRGPEAVIEEMCTAIRALSSRYCGSMRLLGAGVGVPGIIDMSTGTLRKAPNLPGWQEYPVREAIEHRLGAPVVLENDANAAAFGEAWLGAARGRPSSMMITLGTGVGGGIVLAGRIWQGMTGMAGEVGHITINPDGPPCPCGSRGCAEQYASATAILRMAREKIAAGSAAGLARLASSHDVEFNAKCVYELAMTGDTVAIEIFEVVGWALGILIADLVNALNLHTYVIGGGVSAAWKVFSPRMFEELRRRSLVYAATAPPPNQPVGASSGLNPETVTTCTTVTLTQLGPDAGLFGDARLPMLASVPG